MHEQLSYFGSNLVLQEPRLFQADRKVPQQYFYEELPSIELKLDKIHE